jgi:hypothetical protein
VTAVPAWEPIPSSGIYALHQLAILSDSGFIENTQLNRMAMAAKMLAAFVSYGDLDATDVVEESCGIVGTPVSYPGREVWADRLGRLTPVMVQQRRL